MINRDIFQKDPSTRKLVNEGVANVNDENTSQALDVLRYELETFVCDGQYEKGLAHILEIYLKNIEQAQQSAVWISGFYGSGKSHLVKMLRALWVDTVFADGATLSYSGKFSRMKIRFLMDSKSGKVRISLDGKEQEVLDLYSETSSYKVIEIKDKTTFIPGIYFSSLLLPLHKIKGIKISTEREKDKFRIEGVRIKSSRREILLPVNKGDYVSEIVFENREFKDKIFSPTLFGVQILLAFLMAYLLYEFLSLPERLKQSSWKSTFLYVFIREKHFLFWVMFIISSGIFSLWLLGHWPASMSPDSMDTWLQVEGRNFHNHHPYVYSMYVLFLTQFIDTPSVVCIFQILLISLLGSFIFYFAIKNGVSFYLVLPFFFLFIFSVPVGLFNIVLWKDIPFSFLIIFWAFYLYYRSYRKKKDLKDSFSFKKIFLLSFLFIFLCMVRHNGIVYIVCLPFFLAISGVMTKKEFVRFLILSCSLFILFRFIIPELIGVRGLKEVFSNPGRIIKNESNLMVKSVFGAYLPEYMSEKTYIFLKTLNGRDNEIYYNLLTDRDQLLSANPTIFKTTYRIALSPKSNFLYKIQSNILYRSFTDISIRLLIWNSLVPFFMLLVVFLLYRWLPLSALYSLFILVQPLCLFFVSHVTSWRYMYFIYLSGFFVFPLVFLEIKDRCRQRVMKDSQ
ncbi:MAG: hypothetical protein BWY64_03661 [bacterium ADurb.Bin363]|nr:MAG: hypothetical protein BWY64_03661 [bacterium ADurb.Bin363]